MKKFEVRDSMHADDFNGLYLVGQAKGKTIITKRVNKEFIKFCWLSGVERLTLQVWWSGMIVQYLAKSDADFIVNVDRVFGSPVVEPEIKQDRDKLLYYLKNYKGPKSPKRITSHSSSM